jgi:acyl-coenzyme A synthetase/AMP-(fatty) acid ligase
MRYVFRAHCVGATYVSVKFPETRRGLAELIAAHGITIMTASPAQVRPLLQEGGAPVELRVLSVGGAPFAASELRKARESLCRNTHIQYGSNETGPIAILYPEDPPGEDGCVGRPLPDVLCESVDGELRFRVPWMPGSYVDNPEASAARFRDGWFHPGDLGSIDADGFVTLRGRTDDVINYGGVKILPSAIEAVLREHPGVADVAVVGLTFPLMGEVPVAFVVPRGNSSRHAVEDFCRARIDATRLPHAFVRVESIPRNASGKVDREALRRTPISSIRLAKR